MSTLAQLLNYRWSPAVLAELHRGRAGGRFVALAHFVGLPRESLRRTLAALIEGGLVRRNPGYGHPLRPEYVLTARGTLVAPHCAELVAILNGLDIEEVALKKWSLPAVMALRDGGRRFGGLRSELEDVTGRALTTTLKDLVAARLVTRVVTDDYPPATVYALTRSARPLPPVLQRLVSALVEPPRAEP
ncbi:MAG: winged helix-turn-helix transcriptional regulator [Actinobacteria bacterium]|nr:winged helix-turn-helix transcriptional regulator [Actinomycetota bacterium]